VCGTDDPSPPLGDGQKALAYPRLPFAFAGSEQQIAIATVRHRVPRPPRYLWGTLTLPTPRLRRSFGTLLWWQLAAAVLLTIMFGFFAFSGVASFHLLIAVFLQIYLFRLLFDYCFSCSYALFLFF